MIKIALLFLFAFWQQSICFQSSDDLAFLESFINHYEFNPEGRYTHEYHPFLLTQTGQSLEGLESRLQNEHFSLKGRIVIMGYEENAVPQYYTNFRLSKINDEATRKNYAGWSLRLHNRFGFMTGFLFKDIQHLTKKEHAKECVFEHIDADMIPIFDDRATIFHEHAFGQALSLIRKEQAILFKTLIKQTPCDVLQELGKFWELLYGHEFKVSNSQIAGTQDVLFSIAYVQHLQQSSLPLFKFFIGPDITYPIEITNKQNKEATQHAQHFVKEMAPRLVPIDGKKTVYIFCSFVDGVGKSTMLGNIKNWMRFGSSVENFEHVDNSSSQLCELFQFKDNVYIADLPAQISHFTYKPDGCVFVDIRTQCDDFGCQDVEGFVAEHRDELKQASDVMFARVKEIIALHGCNAPELNDRTQPLYAFVKNVVLLKKEYFNQWIPFAHEGAFYLFKDTKTPEIRFLTQLAKVKSEGLKNIEAEQMLFFDGIRLPLPFQDFLDDLVAQFKSQNIVNVVFVDFLSMYPRSSRENIRVNYLLQQMALLDNSFQPQVSLYKDFVSGGELLYVLLTKKYRMQLYNAFDLEAIARLELFKLIINRGKGGLTQMQMPMLTDILALNCVDTKEKYKQDLSSLLTKKITQETKKLENVYGFSKSFINVQQFSFDKVLALSDQLQTFFTQNVENEAINALWQNPGNLTTFMPLQSEGERINTILTADRGYSIKGCFAFHPECKHELILSPLIRSLRACWYAAVLNLISAKAEDRKHFFIKDERYMMIPLMLVRGADSLIYAIQHQYEPWQDDIAEDIANPFEHFNLMNNKSNAYVSVLDVPYRVDWECKATNAGLFGFDCMLHKGKKKKTFLDSSTVSGIVQKHHNDCGSNYVITTNLVWELLNNDVDWSDDYDDLKETAQKNGLFNANKEQKDNSKDQMDAVFDEFMFSDYSDKVFAGAQNHKPVMRMLIRLLATIEMVIKDPGADVVIRYGNRDDFKAAIKLLECVVLPRYCNIIFVDDLFNDYDRVEPYPSWEFWDKISD